MVDFLDALPGDAGPEFRRIDAEVVIPLRTDKHVVGAIFLDPEGDMPNADRRFVTTLARFVAVAIENAHLLHQATTDRMTRLYTHHFFEKALSDEIQRANRFESTFSLIMLDIDHFKAFNDTYGHVAGDAVIRSIADVLRSSTRGIDLTARYGGEEFVVILPGVQSEGAAVVAERIRSSVAATELIEGDARVTVTVSVGVAEYDPSRTTNVREIVTQADRALYESKDQGRNRVTVA